MHRIKSLFKNEVKHNFQEIFDSYYPGICRRIAYLLGSQEAVEDIAQEVFLKLYYSPPPKLTNIGGWLSRVAANLTYNYINSEKSRKKREVRSETEDNNKVIVLEDVIMKKHKVKEVQDILQEMKERDRMVLLLRFSGYSYQEIAEVVGIEKSSVGTVLARAQAKFKALYLKKEGGGDSCVL